MPKIQFSQDAQDQDTQDQDQFAPIYYFSPTNYQEGRTRRPQEPAASAAEPADPRKATMAMLAKRAGGG